MRTLVAPPAVAAPSAPRPPAEAPRRIAPAAARAPAPVTTSAQAAPAPAAPAPPADTAPAAPAAQAAPSAPAEARPAPRTVGMAAIPSDYVTKVFDRINRYAADSYPRAARLRREEGRIAYRLTLDPDGRVQRVDITSSGNDDLDAAARDAIRAAAPFPKPPDLGASAYQLAGTIVYQLTD
ncbi:TonB family protein [Burkholderia alba]|uniref:TonB family protein n=1 Tax=Burkholderia alba TaxID=2683677 RepID=UPI002B05D02E|nr:TonB family protein [Burkholderia alba]